jgi:ABC-type sugar transport system substrate-binding protein
VRITVTLLTALLTAAALPVLATPAAAAPEPCVTVQDPFHPGYTAPTCPLSVARDLLP